MALTFGTANFTVVRGLTWAERAEVTDEFGTPINLTGATFLMRVRTAIDNPVVLMELSSANGRLSAPTPTNGVIQILVSADDTLVFPENNHVREKYVYDLVILRTGPPEVREPVIGGKVTVRPQVTRSWTP